MARFRKSYGIGRSSAATVDGLSGSEISSEIAERNATIQYRDDGVDIGTKGGIEYIDFTGAGVTATNPSAGLLQVDVTSGGGASSITTVEVNLGAIPRLSGTFDITTTGLTADKAVIINQANAPYTDKGTLADEAEMDNLTVTGRTTSTTNIQCFWRSDTFVLGNFKFDYLVGS